MNLTNCIINSGPGTGKTEYMKNTIRYLLSENILQEDEILGITFMKVAATNMKERLSEFPNLDIRTIHSYCASNLKTGSVLIPGQLLKQMVSSMATTKETYYRNIKPTDITIKMIDTMLENWAYYWFLKSQSDPNFTLNDYQNNLTNGSIEQFYNDNFSNLSILPDEYKLSTIYSKIMTRVKHVYAKLVEFNYVTYYTTLTYAYFTVRDENLKYVLVDEFQDFTYTEYLTLLKIAPNAKFLFLCDTYQGIFKWRRSNFIGNVNHFKKNHELETHQLQNNYRCSKAVLQLANAISNRTDINMNGIEGKVVDETAHKSYEDILNHIKRAQEAGESVAVLFNTNKSAISLTKFLKRNHMAVDHKMRNNFSDYTPTATFMSQLNYKLKPFDTYALIDFISCNEVDDLETLPNLLSFFKLPVSAEYLMYQDESFLVNGQPDDETFVIFDTETTGTNTSLDDIIQIAAIKLDSKFNKIEVFNHYLKTDRDLTASEAIHHISNQYLDEHGELPTDVYKSFIEFVGNATMVAHNANFDKTILLNKLRKSGLLATSTEQNQATSTIQGFSTEATPTLFNPLRHWVDTLDIARRVIPISQVDNYKLESLAKAFNFKTSPNHNAMFDVEATVELFSLLPSLFQSHKDFKEIKSHSYLQNFNNIKEVYGELYSYTVLDLIPDLTVFGDTAEDIFVVSFFQDVSQLLTDGFSESEIYNYYADREVISTSKSSKVTVSTVHQAKGLEFDTVIYYQERDSFIREDDVCDEQSVDNVAVSRAIKNFIFMKDYKCRKSLIANQIAKLNQS